MSCHNCHYISGHDRSCPYWAEATADDIEARLMARIEALEERVRQLEERNEVRDRAVMQTGGRIPR
jgi:hypothetical protein